MFDIIRCEKMVDAANSRVIICSGEMSMVLGGVPWLHVTELRLVDYNVFS